MRSGTAIFAILVCVGTVLSCNRLEEVKEAVATGRELEFTSSFAGPQDSTGPQDPTRTQISNSVNILWSPGDSISICERTASEGSRGALFTARNGGDSAVFRGLAPELENYNALHPYSAVRYWKADGTPSVYTCLPPGQKAIRGNLDPAALLMCAKTNGGRMHLEFKTIVAIVKFTIDESSPCLRSIGISAPGQYLAGSSAVNTAYSSPALAGTGAKTSSATLSKEDSSALEPGDYYMAVIPRTYKDLEFSFTDIYGRVCRKTVAEATLGAGTVCSAGRIPDLFGSSDVERYDYSADVPRSSLYTVVAGGGEHLVYPTDEAHICCFGADKAVDVYVSKAGVTPSEVTVRPLAKKVPCSVEGDRIRLSLSPYDRVSVEIDGDIDHPLFIFVNPFETDRPSKTDSRVKYLGAGHYNDSHYGINLTDTGKKILYLEGGAVLKANIAAQDDSDIEVRGFGILDTRGTTTVGADFTRSSGISVSGITLVNSSSSCFRFTECSGISCDNCKVVATASPIHQSGAENDAYDFFGCREVSVTRCFGYCHDDVYIIASKSLSRGFAGPTYGYSFNDCIGWNVKAGNTFEIGYATALDVSDVTFRDCHSIHSNNGGVQGSRYTHGAMAIHSCSYGTVRNVSFEGIHVEDPHHRVLVLEIRKSPFDDLPDYRGGNIRNISFKDIEIYREGAEPSIFTGYDADHRIDSVGFVNYNLAGKRCSSLTDAGITDLSYSYNVSFDGGAPTSPGNMETYTYSETLSPSPAYRVSGEEMEQFVYPSGTLDGYDEQLHICSFGCLDCVTLKVRPVSGTASSAVVRPTSIDWSSDFADNTLTLKMKPCDRAIVEFDGDYKHPLLLFANEPEERPENATYHFKAGGVYDHDQIKLKSGESVYVEGGAVVHTTVRGTNVSDVSIKGTGIIDASEISAYSVHLNKFTNLETDGICTIGRDASVYWIAGGTGLKMHNTKGLALFSRRNTSGNENDALDLVSVNDALVTKGFSYTHDDCCVVKANVRTGGVLYEGTSRNILVDDFISAYRDSGHGFGIGYSCFAEISGVTFRNIWVPYDYAPRVSYSKKGQLAVHNTGDGTVSDITFENAHLEQASRGQAFFISIFKYADHDYGTAGYVPGHIEGVKFKDIYLDDAPLYGNYIIGYDGDGHRIPSVTFENLWYGGRKILNRTDARITDGEMGGYDRVRFKFADEPSFK